MRTLSKLTAIFIVISALIFTCSCGNEKKVVEKDGNYYDEEAGVTIERYGEHVYFISCDKLTENYTLPTEYNGYAIKNVAENAMAGNSTIVELTIPDGYEDICVLAFTGCENLKKVNLGKDVINIREFAFSNCPNLTAFTVSSDNSYLYEKDGCILTKNTDTLVASNGKIPESTIIIGSAVFANNSNLSDVVIPDGVEEIRSFAFDSSSLSSVTIGKDVYRIDKYAFSECDNLKEIYIPKNVTQIGVHIFGGIDGIVINCEAESKPDGWDDEWSVGCANVTINWGVTK